MATYEELIARAQSLTLSNGRTKSRDSVFVENALSYIGNNDADQDLTQWAWAGDGSNTSDVTDLGDGVYRIVFDSTPSGGWGVYRRNDFVVSTQGDFTLAFDILVESTSGDTSDLGLQVRGGATYSNFYFKEDAPTIINEWRTLIGSDAITDNDIRLDFGMNTVGTASILVRNVRFVPVSTVRSGEVARFEIDTATVNEFTYYGSTEADTYNAVPYEDDTLTATPTTTSVGSVVAVVEPVGWTGGSCPGSPNGTIFELGSLKIVQSGSDWLVQNDTGTIETFTNLFATSDRHVIFIDWDGVNYTVQLNQELPVVSASSYQPAGTLYIGNNSASNGVFGGKVSTMIYVGNLSSADKTTLYNGINYVEPELPIIDIPDFSNSTGRKKIILLGDLHEESDLWYLEDNAPALGTIQKLTSQERADLVAQYINLENPDLVISLGDATHNDYTLPLGYDAFGAFIDTVLRDISAPVRMVNSSHDFYTDEQWSAKFAYDKDGVVDFGDYAFVIMNNWVDDAFVSGQGYNYTEVDQVWLADTMNSLVSKKAVYIVSHYVNSGTDASTRSLLASYPNYSGMFFGHLHNQDVFDVDGYNWAVSGNFSWPDTPPWDDNNPWALRVIEIDDSGIANTYMVNVEYNYPNGLNQSRAEVNYLRMLPGGTTGTAQTPNAPVITGEDNYSYTITFENVSGYFTNEHEYSVDSGSNWNPITSNTIQLPYGVYGVGDVQVRVKQKWIDNAGSVALNTSSFDLSIPPAPSISLEDNDTNTFSWINASGPTEVSTDNGSSWFDQESPYDVGSVDIPVGELQVRVKADGVNSAGTVAASTIAFTEATQIDRTPIVLYVNDLNIPLQSFSFSVRLQDSSVKYKDAILLSETLSFTPDANGKISFSLPDTDRMDGDCYYLFSIGSIKALAKVPESTSSLNFVDLPKLKFYK